MSDRRWRASDRRSCFEEVRGEVPLVRGCAPIRVAAHDDAPVGKEDRRGVIAAHVLHVRPELKPCRRVLRVEDLGRTAVGERLNAPCNQDASVRKQHGVDLIAGDVHVRQRLPGRGSH